MVPHFLEYGLCHNIYPIFHAHRLVYFFMKTLDVNVTISLHENAPKSRDLAILTRLIDITEQVVGKTPRIWHILPPKAYSFGRHPLTTSSWGRPTRCPIIGWHSMDLPCRVRCGLSNFCCKCSVSVNGASHRFETVREWRTSSCCRQMLCVAFYLHF